MYVIFSVLSDLVWVAVVVGVVLAFRRGGFARRLGRELARWQALGLVSPEQAQGISALYAKKGAGKKGSGYLVRLTFFMAGMLLCVGVVLFYAANWRAMPAYARLAQVFLLLFGTYAASWYFSHMRAGTGALGRIFLLLGMVSYGAGIFLTAQIFHISAHPSNGALAWFLGVLAMAAVTGEPFGFWLAALALMVWNGWEVFIFESPNWLFGPFAALLLYIFSKKNMKVGAALAFGMLVYFFGQVNLVGLEGHRHATDQRLFLLGFAHLPLGCLCLLAAERAREIPGLSLAAPLCRAYGWLCLLTPFLALSWPMRMRADFPAYVSGNLFYTIELAALLLALLAALYIRGIRPSRDALFIYCALFASLALAAPIGGRTQLMTVMHVGLVFFLMAGLYTAALSGSRLDRTLVFACAVLALAVKGGGFFALGLGPSRRYFAASLLGYMIFGTVVFLVNQSVAAICRMLEKPYRTGPLDFAWAVAGMLALYALSFQVKAQVSIFSADRTILVLLGVFLGLALAFYAALLRAGAEKLPLGLSGLVLLLSTLLLALTGPDLSWKVFSLAVNGLLFVCLGTLLYYGVHRGSRAAGNLALAGFLILVVTRYFDLFWDLLSGSALFIATGIFALVFGFSLDRVRRRLAASAPEAAGKEGPQ